MDNSVWTEEKITEFWSNNEAPYAGDTTASMIIKLAKKHIKGKVLDIGAGSGALIRLIPEAIGLDVAPKHPGIIKGSIAELPFPNSSFDTIFMTDLLEHLPWGIFERGLTEVSRILKIDGKVIITVPNKEDLNYNTVYCPNCQTTFHRWGHQQRFTDRKIDLLLSDYGLYPIKISALPLGIIAEHPNLRLFWKLMMRAGFVRPSSLFVIARKGY